MRARTEIPVVEYRTKRADLPRRPSTDRQVYIVRLLLQPLPVSSHTRPGQTSVTFWDGVELSPPRVLSRQLGNVASIRHLTEPKHKTLCARNRCDRLG